nr:photosystem II protein Y [Meringosphaera mediterranea]
MDFRIIFTFLPVIIAASWALYNIGRLALQQIARLRSN